MYQHFYTMHGFDGSFINKIDIVLGCSDTGYKVGIMYLVEDRSKGLVF